MEIRAIIGPIMKRDSKGKFAKELNCEREKDRRLLYQRRWRAKKNLCTKCAKRPKMPGNSRCGKCALGEETYFDDFVDLVNLMNPEPGKPNRMRSYRKMMKALQSKKN
jgi:hypothetical protein